MFTIDDILKRVQQRPFRPFRILVSSGASIEVTHPELILVGQTRVVVGRAGARRPNVFVDLVDVARMHIACLQDIEAASSKETGVEGGGQVGTNPPS